MIFERRMVVRGSIVALAAAVCACAMPPQQRGATEDGVFISEGVASVHSFECAHSAVASRGYTVNWYDGGQETLRAERRFGDGSETYRGFLTVFVTQNNSGRYLRVSAERWRDATRLPIPANPTPQPTPRPTPPHAAAGAAARVEPGEPWPRGRRRAPRGWPLRDRRPAVFGRGAVAPGPERTTRPRPELSGRGLAASIFRLPQRPVPPMPENGVKKVTIRMGTSGIMMIPTSQ